MSTRTNSIPCPLVRPLITTTALLLLILLPLSTWMKSHLHLILALGAEQRHGVAEHSLTPSLPSGLFLPVVSKFVGGLSSENHLKPTVGDVATPAGGGGWCLRGARQALPATASSRVIKMCCVSYGGCTIHRCSSNNRNEQSPTHHTCMCIQSRRCTTLQRGSVWQLINIQKHYIPTLMNGRRPESLPCPAPQPITLVALE